MIIRIFKRTPCKAKKILQGVFLCSDICKTARQVALRCIPRTEEVPDGYKEISFVCLRSDGAYESPSTVGVMTRSAKKKLEGFEDFHFHMLRHTFTSNLLSNGAAPKDVQELLGHADVSTTMNIYAHSKREAKRTSARLLDKVVGEA